MNIIKIKKSLMNALLIVFTQIIYRYLFGRENAIIGCLMGLGAATLLNRDLYNNLIYKGFTLVILNISLGIISYLGSLNIYLSFILNILTIFSVTYIYINDFRMPTSYIFLMVYIFMWSIPISIDKLPNRLLALGFGVGIIMALQFMLNRKLFYNRTKTILLKTLKHLEKDLELISKGCLRDIEEAEINHDLRKLTILLNERAYKRYYHSNQNTIIFKIIVSIERLSIIIFRLSKANYEVDIKFLEELRKQIKCVIEILEGKGSFKKFEHYLNTLVKKYDYIFDDSKYGRESSSSKYSDKSFLNQINNMDLIIYESIKMMFILKVNIELFTTKSNFQLGKINKNIERPKEFKTSSRVKRNLNLKSSLFRYSLKLAIILSISMFVIDMFNIQYGKWIVVTMYVLLQPYSEDTKNKAKNRFKGTGIGVIIFLLIFSFVKDSISKNIILFIAFSFYFYYEEYYKKVIALTIISLSSISLIENIDILSLNRLVYVLIGVLLVVLFDKYVFPYSIYDSIDDLKEKYTRLIAIILKDIDSGIKINNYKNMNAVMICSQIEEKLIINNKRVKDSELEIYVHNTHFALLDIEYLMLIQNTEKYNFKSKAYFEQKIKDSTIREINNYRMKIM